MVGPLSEQQQKIQNKKKPTGSKPLLLFCGDGKDEVALRKSKLTTEDIQGKNCLTNFHGMDLTHEKMCSMVKRMADHD
ncbi:hypothetical protein E2I00_000298 [Balaenoptera physalus]|uniref:Uncharacterized protein n=1 Tax=Balaenoptera physalus TaxID=9770 RepID=A0A643BLN3_BALPH|nr:hypothetical protein E2I00_000298 [Balaenoptera physalus]